MKKKMRNLKRIKKIYEVYKKTYSKMETGKVLGISGERVRQLLQRGHDEGLFKLLPPDTLRLSGLFKKIDKFDLIRTIETARTKDEILSKYAIKLNEFNRLLKCFGLSFSGLNESAGITRCLSDYFRIFNILGHHPSTTEFQSNKTWRPAYMRICFRWGTLDKFRKIYGFPKPRRKKMEYRARRARRDVA